MGPEWTEKNTFTLMINLHTNTHIHLCQPHLAPPSVLLPLDPAFTHLPSLFLKPQVQLDLRTKGHRSDSKHFHFLCIFVGVVIFPVKKQKGESVGLNSVAVTSEHRYGFDHFYFSSLTYQKQLCFLCSC